MSRSVPRTVDEMIGWLRAHPAEPFFTLYSARRLLVGTRNDEGEIAAYDCVVTEDRWQLDALGPERKPITRERRTKPATARPPHASKPKTQKRRTQGRP